MLVLRTFLKDRPSQLALGTFVGTFVYALLGLRRVRGEGGAFDRSVPSFTVWLSVILALASVAAFVGFIHHVAQSIRAGVVIRRIGDETRASLDRLYPEGIGEDVDEAVADPDEPLSLEVPNAGRAGVLAGVDAETLMKTATGAGVVLRVVSRRGDFVAHGAPLLEVYGAADALDVMTAVSALRVRAERDAAEDTAYGVRELVDIAERALSPSVNDPSTAVQVIDEIHDILRRLARRRFPSAARRAESGELRAILPGFDFDAFVRLALDEIRQYARGSVQVLRRLRELVEDVMTTAPPHRRVELSAQLCLLDAAVRRSVPDEHDRAVALGRSTLPFSSHDDEALTQ